MDQSAKLMSRGFSALYILVLVVLIILAAGGWFYYSQSSKDSNPQPQTQGPAEKLRVGNVGEYTIFNLIAKEKGFFAQNGLDVEIKEYTSGPASLEGMFKGETDINVAADFVGVRNIFDHPDLRILSQVNYHRVFQVVSRKSLGITNPQDLVGKKVGVTKNSAGEYFLGTFLSGNNIQLEKITMVNLTPTEMTAKLETGEIDAVALFEPHIYKLKTRFGDDIVSWDVQGEHNISALVYSTEPFIKAHPQLVEKYIKSLLQAEDYYQANPQEVKQIIARLLKYEQSYIDYSWPKFTHFIGLNQELVLNMEDEARWVIKNKLTTQTKVPNYLEYIYFDALAKLKPGSVTIIH